MAELTLVDLQRYLNDEFPGCTLIPSQPGGKIPRCSHKNGHYTAQRFLSEGHAQCRDGCLIVLSQDIIVIDVDDAEALARLEDGIPELHETVCCQTAKGRHFYFRATSRTRQANMKDGARQMKMHETGCPFPIDIKTMSSSGTGGLISIPPSPNKSWVRALGVGTVLPMPDAFVDFYLTYTDRAATSSVVPRPPHVRRGDDFDEAVQLVDMLASWRATERNDWISVGWCLHTIDHGVDMLGVWDRFSQRCPAKYVRGECARLWATMREDGLRIGTLHMWARTDSPTEYARYMSERVYQDVRDCDGSQTSIANIAYKLYSKKYVCASTNGKLWYHFNGTLWEEDPEGIRLRKEASRQLRDQFVRVLGRVRMEDADEQSSSASAATNKNRELCERLLRISYRLQESNYKDGLMKELRDLFYDRDFLARLDTNKNLIAFTNGVWELREKRFRAATYDDWLSLSVGYAWSDAVQEAQIRDGVVRYFEQLHPWEEQRTYVLKMLARQLYGDTGCELFHVHSGYMGSASNGKTKFFEVLELVLGDYVREFPVEMLVVKQRGEAHRPVPEFKWWRGRRILYCSEPNVDERINSGVMKALTGGEAIQYRMLFSNDLQQFRPIYKMHIMCNDAPQLDGADEGVRRRIRKLEYVSRFVDAEAVDESAHMYLKDLGFVDRFRDEIAYRLEFLKYVLEHYDHEFRYEMPRVVRENSIAYVEDNNCILKFVRTYIKEDRQGWFTLKDAKEAFKDSEYYDPKANLKTSLEKTLRVSCVEQKRIGPVRLKYVFLGYSMKEDEEASDDQE